MRAQTLAQVRLLPLARLHGRYGRPCARIRSFSYLRDPTVVSHDRYEVTAGASNTRQRPYRQAAIEALSSSPATQTAVLLARHQ